MVVGEQAAADLECLLEQRLGLRVLPLGVKVARHIVVASSGVGVVVGEQSAVDLQRLLEQRLGLRMLPLGGEVERQVVIAAAVSGWSSVSRRRLISSAFSKSGWAWAYFPCELRSNARLL